MKQNKKIKQHEKTKVLVAMSGGVDSSVAALLMKQQGFQIAGAFMKNWSDTKNEFGECTWKDDRKEAMKVAAKLKIPLITLDFEKQYRKIVIDEMFKLYSKGITPNPDIDCNQKLKFPLLWKTAKNLGFDFIATGHYARIRKIPVSSKNVNNKNNTRVKLVNNSVGVGGQGEGGGLKYEYQLLRAKDESKDQSYFLYRLSQDDLQHSLFPIGNYKKTKVRKIAERHGFQNFNRKGTVGICFVGKVRLKDFLQVRIPPKPGKILDPEGRQIGTHDGIYYYTIGQRIGTRFGIEINKGKQMSKWYIARKIQGTNTIIAAPEGDKLNFRKEIYIKEPHWINKSPINIKNSKGKRVNVKSTSSVNNKNNGKTKSIKVLARIRQVGELLPSKLKHSNGKYKVILQKPITGVSEGQAIVLYQKTKVLGGGVISFN